MKVVILAGGKGFRYNSDVPKPMAKIGGKPIIHHILDIYANQGIDRFIIALGYKKETIINYFDSIDYEYIIEFVDTKEESNTAERIRLIQNYIPRNDKEFFCTYADGLANVNIQRLYDYHISSQKIATLTIIKPYHQYGIIRTDSNNNIIQFYEKPQMSEYINGGFFCFNKDIFKFINESNEDLEFQVFTRLLYNQELKAYKHNGFWDTVNTPKDEIRLNDIYNEAIRTNNIVPWYNIK